MLAAESLDALLSPRSVAVLGASGRPGRPGFQVVQALGRGGQVAVYPVTPRYEEVAGIPCVAGLEALDGSIDLAVVASGPDRIETDARAAIEHGARGLIIFGAVSARRDSRWSDRIGSMAREADVALLGPDSLGYVDFGRGAAPTWALPAVGAGGIALISQSGTIFWEANTNDPRLGFSLTAHTGMEVSVTAADMLAHAVKMPETEVVGLYLETVRDPDGFVDALELAGERGVPVVALFAGRTNRSRAQMTTHAGRLAGDRAAFEAIFRRHSVATATTPDEWWSTLALLGSSRRARAGGLAALLDSGAGIALLLDLAEELGVPLAPLSGSTRGRLSGLFDTEDVGNPVDFWGGEADLAAHTEQIVGALAEDETTGMVLAFTTYGESAEAGFAHALADACRRAPGDDGAPVVAATYTSRQLHPDLMVALARDGVVTLDGIPNALLAVRHAFDFRDFGADSGGTPVAGSFDSATLAAWRQAVGDGGELSESDALALLDASGIPVVPTRRATSETEVVEAATGFGFPVVLKTDEGIGHKAAVGGVHLGLAGPEALRRSYREMAGALGPKVVVASMRRGVEVALGIVVGQFGPMLMVATGGGDIEALHDRRYLLAPTSPEEVTAAIGELQVGRLLGDTERGELVEVAVRLGSLGWALRDVVSEIDVNPLLVEEGGCVAVDALVVGRSSAAVGTDTATTGGGDEELG